MLRINDALELFDQTQISKRSFAVDEEIQNATQRPDVTRTSQLKNPQEIWFVRDPVNW